MDKFLICSDLDGTLLTKNQSISDNTKGIINEFLSDGHHFAVSTGRMYNSAKYIANSISQEVDVIASNGALLEIENELKPISKFSSDDLDYIYNCCVHYNLPLFFFSKDTVYYSKTAPSYFKDKSDTGRVDAINLVCINTFEEFSNYKDNYINGIVIEEEDLGNLENLRIQLKKNNSLSVVSSHFNNIEILPKSIDKCIAVELLRKHYGVKKENVIVFGDGENDIGMLKTAGIGVAMENASANVKSFADKITLSNENEGVYMFLKSLLAEKII